MNYEHLSLAFHEKNHGKVSITSKVPVLDRDELAVAYTPGVAEPCRRIAANPDDVYKYTFKSNMIAVVTNGTAVLGLGNIGAAASLPVMEGKCVLFKAFGGVDVFPVCLDTEDPDEVVRAVELIAPQFGGINLEDIRSPDCFDIEDRLRKKLDIPVFHDDQHGTAIVMTAALLNALKLVGKDLSKVKIVHNGPGAAGTAIIKMLLNAGAIDIVTVDECGILYPGRPAGLKDHKKMLAEMTNPRRLTGSLAEAVQGADVFIGTSVGNCLTPEMIRTMNKDAVVFAMANPTPEVIPDVARAAGARVIGTGRSDFPNQINNVLAFPGIFRGAFDVRASDINEEMKMAAAEALAGLISDEDLNEENVIPQAFDPRVGSTVAKAVAEAARRTGVNRI